MGVCTVGFDFACDGGGMGKGGTGRLSVNGQSVGEGRIERTVPINFSTHDTFDVGEDCGTPVSPTYEPRSGSPAYSGGWWWKPRDPSFAL